MVTDWLWRHLPLLSWLQDGHRDFELQALSLVKSSLKINTRVFQLIICTKHRANWLIPSANAFCISAGPFLQSRFDHLT